MPGREDAHAQRTGFPPLHDCVCSKGSDTLRSSQHRKGWSNVPVWLDTGDSEARLTDDLRRATAEEMPDAENLEPLNELMTRGFSVTFFLHSDGNAIPYVQVSRMGVNSEAVMYNPVSLKDEADTSSRARGWRKP